MTFELDATHRAIRDTARKFASERVAPNAKRWDEQECFPSELMPELAELGFLGINVPERYGGSALDTLARRSRARTARWR